MVGSVGKKYSEAERAYIAGLFDCDGAIMASIESHKEKKFGFRVRVILKVTQKNPNILRWLKSLLKVGYVTKNRTTFDWIVKDQKDCKELLELFKMYTRGKKKQVELGLEILNKLENKKSNKDFLEICKLVDKFKQLNYSKKRKITYETVADYLSP